MSKIRLPFSKRTVALFAASGLLLASGGIGSTVAVLTEFSSQYQADFKLTQIDVQLLENDEVVADGNGFSSGGGTGNLSESGRLLKTMVEKDNPNNVVTEEGYYTPGLVYKEELKIQNNGHVQSSENGVDAFYRVIITKRWASDEIGTPNTALDPSLIELNLVNKDKWIVDESASTPERTILYYTQALKQGESSEILSDTLTINEKIIAERATEGENEYAYDNMYIYLAAEVDGVQANHAEDAMRSAWGIKATVNGNTMSIN